MSNKTIVFSFVADDKPGIVSLLATLVKENKGNWLESELSHLQILFAGIVSVSINENDILQLKTALEQLQKDGINIVRFEVIDEPLSKTVSHRLELIGPDRAGIIQEVSQALAGMAVNILSMKTKIASAPMSGEVLFEADIRFSHAKTNEDELAAKLDEIAEKLTLDVSLSSDE